MQTKTTCGILGYGSMGSMMGGVLRDLGHELVLVDERGPTKSEPGIARSISGIPRSVIQAVDTWFVCTPTSRHLEAFKDVLREGSPARVMIEKPLCHGSDLQPFAELLGNVGATVWVNNHYQECTNLKKAREYVGSQSSKITEISIQFAKNRSEDVNRGRFVDEALGAWGYEGFHMVYLASQLLSPADAQAFLNLDGQFRRSGSETRRVGYVMEAGRLPSGVRTELLTSTNGLCRDDEKWISLVPGQRKREVNISLENGTHIRLLFGADRHTPNGAGSDFGFYVSDRTGAKTDWTSENPLRRHLEKFLDDQTAPSTLSLGIRMTSRLIRMAEASQISPRQSENKMIYTALIGYPTDHSLSPMLFGSYATACGLEYAHLKVNVDPTKQTLPASVASLKELGFSGFNVTIPYKRDIIPLLDSCDPLAAELGAVNTVQISNGKLKGYNTDLLGVKASISGALGRDVTDTDRVVIFGTGGAARAVLGAVRDATQNVTIVFRSPKSPRTIDAENRFGNHVRFIDEKDPELHEAIRGANILCNATSVGMSPADKDCIIPSLDIDPHAEPGRVCFDAVYTPLHTTFLKMAQAKGYKIADGLDMMVYQGTEAFRLWTGHEVPLEAVKAARELVVDRLSSKLGDVASPLTRPLIQRVSGYEK